MNLEQFHEELQRRFRRRESPIAGALFAFAAIRQSANERVLLSGRWRYFDEENDPRPSLDYGHVLLGERWFAAHDSSQVLSDLLQGSSKHDLPPIVGDCKDVSESTSARGWHSSYSDWPEWHFTARFGQGQHLTVANDPLVRFDLRPFPSPVAAVAEWVWGPRMAREWSGGDVPHRQEIEIVLPDPRGRIIEADWSSGRVAVFVRGEKSFSEMQLQVIAVTANGSAEIGMTAPREEERVEWDVPADATELGLYLIDKTGDLLDHASLTGPGQATPSSEEVSSVQQADLDLQSGESVEVEFKPFVKVKDEKEREIVETIVAFSNSSGGRLYVGVRNDGVPEGRAALIRAAATAQDAAVSLFETRLRELARERIKPTPRLAVERLEVAGEVILLARIEKGDDGPYSTHDNDVYVRKGATNRKPDPRTELRALYPQDQDASSFVDVFGPLERVDE